MTSKLSSLLAPLLVSCDQTELAAIPVRILTYGYDGLSFTTVDSLSATTIHTSAMASNISNSIAFAKERFLKRVQLADAPTLMVGG